MRKVIAARHPELVTKKANALNTIGLHVKDIAPHVDIAKHLAGATGARADDLAHYYKNMHNLPPVRPTAAAAPAAAAHVAGPVARKTPTQAVSPVGIMQHASQTLGPAKVLQGAQQGVPALGNAAMLDHLMRSGGGAIGLRG